MAFFEEVIITDSKVLIPHLIRIRFYIRLHLICIGQAVGAVKHIHHGNKFCNRFIIQSEPLHGGAVRINSVGTVVSDGHRQCNDLFG